MQRKNVQLFMVQLPLFNDVASLMPINVDAFSVVLWSIKPRWCSYLRNVHVGICCGKPGGNLAPERR